MTVSLPEQFAIRPATLDDVESVVALANACSVELIGRPEWEAHEFLNDWQSPSIHLETDVRVILNQARRIVGYASVWDTAPHVKLYGRVNVHPQWRGQGLGTYLGHWIETRARDAVAKAPPETRVVLSQDKLIADEPGNAFLLAHGYRVARYFTRMLINVDGPPLPSFPTGIAVRTFAVDPEARQAWLRAIILAEHDVFRDHWGFVEHPLDQELSDWQHWIDHNPDHDPSLWFLAMAGDEIAGFSLCEPRTAEDPGMAYISSLGVKRTYRRQGLGLALLHHSFGEFHRRGTSRVALDVDDASLTGATRLYERAGMHAQRRSALYEKELRPGQDVSTQTLQGSEEG
jgi:mycothiol synthase